METGEPILCAHVMATRGSTDAARAGAPTGWATRTLYAALLTVGLMAGLFFAWDVSVMPGLARLDDRAYVTTMQILIVAIENAGFYLVVLGALVFTAWSAYLHRRQGGGRWIAVALGCYVLALAITMVVHMPLNLDLLQVGQTDPGAARATFETPWRVGNVARTAACSIALLCLGRASMLAGPTRR